MTKQLTAEQRDFRAAMSNLSAAVNVVTTNGPGGRAGITVSAVCSVTDSPPTVLVCVNQSSYTHAIFRRNERLCVNVLSARDEELAGHFAGATGVPMAERFEWAMWDHDTEDIPMLRTAAARVVGRIISDHTQGSHSIFLVSVERVDVRENADALVYFQRRFHHVGTEQESTAWTTRRPA
ncbi:flavin reductase [Nocardia farcinica]|uniref:4-hydroxyphenylacetate 3-monooxygenase reductase component n=3 Tax=Nocardia TaxID=1817 RepID=A0A0H5NH88_NOCFR|nr:MULTISPECIES: flavin reductase [Nocardia]AXK84698.1 4-hydroxyphenylacetate 3-monooxygenase reductase subunit [Nocardia farcinica]MBA4854368.1 flavin reductase [Nocardia farcinica]MBC9814553.1 flavin reductase [Nocardia farcinica]MBF6070783.1 flavin reductase [Nocardia farcinica]MBF6139966.1 flavin reductase [Nocardia farcinica]